MTIVQPHAPARRLHTQKPTIFRQDTHVADLAGQQMLPLEPRFVDPQNQPTDAPLHYSSPTSIGDWLRFHSEHSADQPAFTVVDAAGTESCSWTWERLWTSADKICRALLGKSQLTQGARIGLVYRRSEVLDFMAALYGCLLAGMTAVPVNAIGQLEDIVQVMQETQMRLVLTTENNYRALMADQRLRRSQQSEKEESVPDWPTQVVWWKTDTLSRRRFQQRTDIAFGDEVPKVQIPDLAYIEYTKTANGDLRGVAVSHQTVLAQCRILAPSLKSILERRRTAKAQVSVEQQVPPLSPSSPKSTASSIPHISPSNATVLSWLESRQQVGLVLGGLLGVYQGHHTVFIHQDITKVPITWQACVARYSADVALGDYEGVREMLQARGISSASPPSMKQKVSSTLKAFLIDTLLANPALNERLAKEMLQDMGITEPQDAVFPMVSLAEHGDRHSLKHNLIKVVATGEEASSRASELGVTLVEAFGYPIPQATLAIVDYETTVLCAPGYVGEIWVDSPSIAFGFWGLLKQSQATFHALPLLVNTVTLAAEVYDPVPAGFLRTNLFGGIVQGRLVVFGRCDEQIHQSVQIGGYNVDHEAIYSFHFLLPLYSVVFDFFHNNQVLPVVCAETARTQRADLEMLAEYARQAMQDYHGLRPYCIAIAPQGSLPRGVKNGRKCVLPVVCQNMFEQGGLPLIHVLTSVEDTISNQSLAYGDDPLGGIWGTDAVSVRESRRQPHERVAQFSSCSYPRELIDERTKVDLAQFHSLPDVLLWRSIAHSNDVAFMGTDFFLSPTTTSYSSSSNLPDNLTSVIPTTSTTFHKFGKKVVNIAQFIEKRGGFCAGDRVVLLFTNGVEFVATLYACWFLGLVPVPVQLPEPARALEEMLLLVGLLKELKTSYAPILGDNMADELLKHRATRMHLKAHIGARQDVAVPTVLNVSQAPKMHKALGKEPRIARLPRIYAPHQFPNSVALISVNYSADMKRTLVKVSHASLMAQCRAQKVQCRFGALNAPVVSCWKTFSGLGTLYSSGIGIFSGVPTILLRYSDFMTMPQIYLEALERYQAVNALLSAAMLDRVISSDLITGVDRMFNLSQLRNIVLDVDHRLDPAQNMEIEKRFMHIAQKPSSIDLSSGPETMRAIHINSTFGNTFNPMITSRSYMNVEPVRLYLSMKSLRRGIVEITTEDEDPHGIWVEDSGIPVSGTTVAIVNPETCEVCMSGEIGEIWVSSEANVQSFPTTTTKSPSPRFHATLTGDQGFIASAHRPTFARTGEVGFLWNYAHQDFNGGRATSLLFLLGAIGETLEVNGLMHFAKDVEDTIEQAHEIIAPGGSVVFQADHAVVFVVQVLYAADPALVNLALSVMHRVMEVHQFVPDVIALVDDKVMSRSRNEPGAKMRGKMLSLFMSAKM
ncbi:hypothetical protein MVEG_05666 [Podila verticillata NRRL 6337]|nr:hypothetical protein MVEG_05666 [Podila verticillata NRRL 6337]